MARLNGKEFIAIAVEGKDPLQRGRVKVQIPELMPFIPESEGVFLPNFISSSQITNSNNGTYGSHVPILPGTRLQVKCTTDDIMSGRITGIISDETPKTDMSIGKVAGVEPPGMTIQVAAGGMPDIIKIGLDFLPIDIPFEGMSDMLNGLTDSLSGMLGDLTSGLTDALGGITDSLNGALSGITDSLGNIADSVTGSIGDALGNVTDSLGGAVGDMLGSITGSVGDSIGSITGDMMGSLKDSLSSVGLECFDVKGAMQQFEGIAKDVLGEQLNVNSIIDSGKSLALNQLDSLTGVSGISDAISSGNIGGIIGNIPGGDAVSGVIGGLTKNNRGGNTIPSQKTGQLVVDTVNLVPVNSILTNVRDPKQYQKTYQDLRLTLAVKEIAKQYQTTGRIRGITDMLPGGVGDVVDKLPEGITDQLSNITDVQGLANKFLDANPGIKDKIDVATGLMDKLGFVRKKQEEWQKDHADEIINIAMDQPPANYEYGEGTVKPSIEDQTEQYTVITTPSGCAIYVNEQTSVDPGCLYISFAKKDTLIKMDSNGINISTTHNHLEKTGANWDVDAGGSISIKGKGNIGITTEGNLHLKASGYLCLEGDKGVSITSPKKISLMGTQQLAFLTNGCANFYAKMTMEITAGLNFVLKSNGIMGVNAKGLTMLSKGLSSTKTSGILSMDASLIALNCKMSVPFTIPGLKPGKWPKSNPPARQVATI